MRRTRLALASVRSVMPGTPPRQSGTKTSTPGDGQQRDLYQHTPTQRPARRTRGSS